MKGVTADLINREVRLMHPAQVRQAFSVLDSNPIRDLLTELRNIIIVEQMRLIHTGASVTHDAEEIEKLDEGRQLLDYLCEISQHKPPSDHEEDVATSTSTLTP